MSFLTLLKMKKSKFDIMRYSQFKVGYLIFPICIHISKILDIDYTIPTYKFSKMEIINNEIVKSETNDLFYGKFEKELQTNYIIDLIYDFIDFNTISIVKIDSLNMSLLEFKDYCLNSRVVTINDLVRCYDEIILQISAIKKEFMDLLIKEFDIYRKFPIIPTTPDDKKYETPKEYIEYLKYPNGIIESKAYVEYVGDILFEENIGKSVNEFSWREKEFRKLYITAVTNIDNFSEQVKSYIQKRALNA